MAIVAGDMQSISTAGYFVTAGLGAPPSAPALAVVNDGTGTGVTATVSGDVGVTNRLFYMLPDDAAWTVGPTRVGDGTIPVTGLTANAFYLFIAVADDGGEYSLPSIVVGVQVVVSGLSIIELIAQGLKTLLDQMVVAGDATSVDRPLQHGVPDNPVDGMLVLYQWDPNEDESPMVSKYWVQPFGVACYARASDLSTTAIGTPINELRSRVEQKLRQDYTVGGYAHDLRIRPPQAFITDEGLEGVTVNFDVMYGTLENDPYTQA